MEPLGAEACSGVELSTLGNCEWVWRGLNHLCKVRAHSALPETKASLQSCRMSAWREKMKLFIGAGSRI